MRTLRLLLPLALACAPPPAPEAESSAERLVPGEVTVRWTVPAGETTLDVVLGASELLQLEDRALVGAGDVVSTGSRETRVGNDARVAEDVISRGAVRVWHRARVGGVVRTAGRALVERSASVGAVQARQAFGPDVAEELRFEVPEISNGDVHLEPDRSASVAPGRYGQLIVKSRSTVYLRAGTYFLDRLQLEPQSQVVFDDTDGAVVLVVADDVISRGRFVDGSTETDARLLLAFLGTGVVAMETAFDGYVVAPGGGVRLTGNNTTHRGSFFGRYVQVTPGVRVEHRPLDIGKLLRPFYPKRDLSAVNLTDGQSSRGAWDGCEPGLQVVSDAAGPIGAEKRPAPPGNAPGTPGCVAPVTWCDDDEVPLSPQPVHPVSTSALTTSCGAVDPTVAEPAFDEATRCQVDPTSLGAVCTADDQCASDERCVPCGLLDDCADGERRCGRSSCTVYGAEDSCVELRECARDGATGALDVDDFIAANPDDPPATTSAPAPAVPPSLPVYGGTCAATPPRSSGRNPGSASPAEGSSLWRINLESDFDKFSEVAGAAGGLEKLRLGAKARFKASVTALGFDVEIVDVGGYANLDSCGARAEAVLRVGGQFSTIPDVELSQEAQVGDRAACEAALPNDAPGLPDLLAATPPPGGIWLEDPGDLFGAYEGLLEAYADADDVIQATSTFGLVDDLCRNREQARDPVACDFDAACPPCDARTATLDDVQFWLRRYEDEVRAFEATRDAVEANLGGLRGELEIPVGGFGDSFLLRAPPIDIPIGPFKIGIEVGVGGGYEVPFDVRMAYDPLGARPAEAGVVVTPSAYAQAEAYVNFGVSIGIASADIGVTTNLRLLEIGLPIEAKIHVDRAESVDTRPGTYSTAAANLLLDTRRSYDLGFSYGMSLTGELLSGTVDLTVRARFLFFTARYSQRLASWSGIRLPEVQLVGGAGSLNVLDLGEFAEPYGLPDLGVLQFDASDLPASPPGGLLVFPELGQPCVPPVIIK